MQKKASRNAAARLHAKVKDDLTVDKKPQGRRRRGPRVRKGQTDVMQELQRTVTTGRVNEIAQRFET